MRSRTVQPVKRREQSKNMRGKKKKNAIGDTQPIKVSSHTKPLRVSSDTQPIRIPSGQRQTRSASYRGRYQQAVSRRRKEISVPKPEAQLERKVKKSKAV